tara:strand:- start:6489 stop:7379 length:891 start_codon:yes stop_codon:yes gene_type:complete
MIKLGNFFNSIKFIINHPLVYGERFNAILRYIKFHVLTRIKNTKRKISFVNGTMLIIKRDLSGASTNYFTYLADFEEMMFMLHVLRSDNLFFDIGSNIGSWTILASGVVGSKSVSIEPIKESYYQLIDNINLNNLNEKVTLYNIALGSKDCDIKMSKQYGALNRIIMTDDDYELVGMKTLDQISCNDPFMIKIDVEGYEMEVLNGGSKTLSSASLQVIIIELNGSAKKYGSSDIEISNKIIEYGFIPISYNPFKRKIIELKKYNDKKHNTIFIRNYNFVKKNIEISKKINIGKFSI